MNDQPDDRPEGHDWKGLKEIDQAIAENRLTAYTWKKTWADPWGRIKILVVLALLAGFIAYTIFDELAI